MFVIGSETINTENEKSLVLNQSLAKGDYYDHLFRLHLVGAAKAGKTALITKFAEDKFGLDSDTLAFIEHHQKDLTQLGVESNLTHLDYKCGNITILDRMVKFSLWNNHQKGLTKSIEKSMTPHGILFICDLTDAKSIQKLKQLHGEVKTIIDGKSPQIYLVGTKKDLADQKISEKEIIDYAEKIGCNGVAVVSSKSGDNIKELFEAISCDLMLKYGIAKSADNTENNLQFI